MTDSYRSRVVAHGPHRARFDSGRSTSGSPTEGGGDPTCYFQHHDSQDSCYQRPEEASVAARHRGRRQDPDGVERSNAASTARADVSSSGTPSLCHVVDRSVLLSPPRAPPATLSQAWPAIRLRDWPRAQPPAQQANSCQTPAAAVPQSVSGRHPGSRPRTAGYEHECSTQRRHQYGSRDAPDAEAPARGARGVDRR